MLTCALICYPEQLVPGKFNIVGTHHGLAAILWKDGQYFIINVRHPGDATPISESQAFSIACKGGYICYKPVPLDDLSEWLKRTDEVDIPLRSHSLVVEV